MKNVTMIENATRPFVGKVLSSKQIQAVVLAMYPPKDGKPQIELGSILPSDYAGPNKSGNVYADQLFTREATGYGVLPTEKIVRKPKTSRSRETLQDALASAKALLSVPQASKPANATVAQPQVPVVVAAKANGEAKAVPVQASK